MALFVNPNRTVQYVVKEERELPADQQHIFTLKTLSHREWEERQDYSRQAFEGETEVRVNTGAWVRWSLYYGLVDAKGPSMLVPFKGPDDLRVSDAFLDALNPSVRIELAREVERLCRMGRDDPKD